MQQFLENAAGSLRRVASSFCKAKSNSNQNNTPYKKQSKQATAFCACLKIHRNIQPISKKNRKNNVVTQQRKMRSKANSAAFLPDATGLYDLESIVSFQKEKICEDLQKGLFSHWIFF